MHKSTRAFLAFAALLYLSVVAQSATIDVGFHWLLPNTPNQHVEIFITGGDLINADNLAASVGTGNQVNGPNLVDGPTITGIDVLGLAGFHPTIFTGNNLGAAISGPPGPTKRTAENGTVTQFDNPAGSGNFNSVTANGLFGTLVFDTTGIFDTGCLVNTWALKLGGTSNSTVPIFSSSDIGTDVNTNVVYPTIVDGTVSILDECPEPSSIVLALFAAAGLAAVAIRRRHPTGQCGRWPAAGPDEFASAPRGRAPAAEPLSLDAPRVCAKTA